MYKDKKALAETLRHYKRHILGPLFTEAADTIEALLAENEELKAKDSCQLNTATPKPGHWIFMTVEDDPIDPAGLFQHRYKCSVCGNWQTYGTTDFCPNCGAMMGNLSKAEHDKEQREYEAAVEAAQYCEMYEPTYDPETGAM